MRKADIRSTIGLLFTAILIVGVFSFIGIMFINSVDSARIMSGRVDWRNEAVMIANKFVSDPNCWGYTKTLIKYINESGNDLLLISRMPIAMAVDRNKMVSNEQLNIKRLDDCTRLRSIENKLFISVKLTENLQEGEKKLWTEMTNLNPNLYKNQQTLQEIKQPIKIISSDGFSYGLLTVTLSVSADYMKAKII